MAAKDLQTLKLKFDQVMFNSLVFMWERNFEVTFGMFSVLISQINVLESCLDTFSVLKLVIIKNVKIVIISGFQIKVLSIFHLYQKNTPMICLILHQFNLHVLLICGKKLVTIKISLGKGS